MKNTTDMVRQFAAAHTIVRRKQVGRELGLNNDALTKIFENLVRGGWLKRTGYGIYQFVDRTRATNRPAPINERLWRAMKVNPRFSATDIARQAGTTRNYANKVLRQYRRAGIVRRMGQRRTTTGSHETVWMLTQNGKKSKKRPTIYKFVPDPLVVKAVSINRLVCTGAAANNPEDAQAAAALCRELAEAIETAFKEAK